MGIFDFFTKIIGKRMEGVLKSSSSHPELDSAIDAHLKSLKEMNETFENIAEMEAEIRDPKTSNKRRREILKQLGY